MVTAPDGRVFSYPDESGPMWEHFDELEVVAKQAETDKRFQEGLERKKQDKIAADAEFAAAEERNAAKREEDAAKAAETAAAFAKFNVQEEHEQAEALRAKALTAAAAKRSADAFYQAQADARAAAAAAVAPTKPAPVAPAPVAPVAQVPANEHPIVEHFESREPIDLPSYIREQHEVLHFQHDPTAPAHIPVSAMHVKVI